MTRSGLAVAGLTVALLAGCGFDSRSDGYQCDPPGNECDDGRICIDGWCVVNHDGGLPFDASHVDASDFDAGLDDDSGCPGPALGFTPSNFDLCDIPASGDAIDLATGDWLLDSDAATLTELPAGSPTPLAASPHTQPSGPEILIVSVDSITIAAGATLTASGSRPLALVAAGSITIGGRLTAPADLDQPGPGGGNAAMCGDGTGAGGVDQSAWGDTAGSGGGGGGYGSGGGDGAIVDNATADPTLGGIGNGDPKIVPLRGGCTGGAGGHGGAPGGGGGGGLQLVAGGDFTVSATGAIGAPGGGAPGVSTDRAGGGGAGSGGAVLIEAHHITIAGFVTAQGGGGSEGSRTETSSGAGENGQIASAVPAVGGSGGGPGGNGGDGAVEGSAAEDGSQGNTQSTRAAGGGGGGGGVGRIHLRGVDAAPTITGTISPSPA